VAYTNNIKWIEGRIAKLENTPAFQSPKSTPRDNDADKKVGKN
jgi:hypothetical protein